MAILLRGGIYDDFDPNKLLPREFAVVLSNDPGTRDGSAIYICFGPGKVKRISTYEDMRADMENAAEEIFQQYVDTFNDILKQIDALKKEIKQYKEQFEAIRDDILNVYMPQIQAAAGHAENARKSAEAALDYRKLSESFAHGNTAYREGEDTDSSEYYCRKAENSRDMAAEYLRKTEQAGDEAVEKINEAISMNVPRFQVDIATGNLLYEGGRFMFVVNAGNLEWGLMV